MDGADAANGLHSCETGAEEVDPVVISVINIFIRLIKALAQFGDAQIAKAEFLVAGPCRIKYY